MLDTPWVEENYFEDLAWTEDEPDPDEEWPHYTLDEYDNAEYSAYYGYEGDEEAL